jgi:hypothetical protein
MKKSNSLYWKFLSAIAQQASAAFQCVVESYHAQRSPPPMDLVTLKFDATLIKKQLDELIELLHSRFPDGVRNDLISKILKLSSDVCLGNCVVTTGTNDTKEIIQSLYFGDSFENLIRALWAYKFSD